MELPEREKSGGGGSSPLLYTMPLFPMTLTSHSVINGPALQNLHFFPMVLTPSWETSECFSPSSNVTTRSASARAQLLVFWEMSILGDVAESFLTPVVSVNPVLNNWSQQSKEDVWYRWRCPDSSCLTPPWLLACFTVLTLVWTF